MRHTILGVFLKFRILHFSKYHLWLRKNNLLEAGRKNRSAIFAILLCNPKVSFRKKPARGFRYLRSLSHYLFFSMAFFPRIKSSMPAIILHRKALFRG